MHVVFIGAGAVGGYYGARLAAAGSQVSFLARGANLRAIRERGLLVWSPLGDFLVRPQVEDDPSKLGKPDLVVFTVKAYDTAGALPAVAQLMGPDTTLLTLQNGVDSIHELAAAFGERRVLGGTTYVAASLILPGVVHQTGTHRRVIIGEVFGDTSRVSDRVQQIADVMLTASIQAEVVADARRPIWEKFVYLAPYAGFTGAARLSIGGIWPHQAVREAFLESAREVVRVAAAEGVEIAPEVVERFDAFNANLPPTARSSLLMDLELGKPIEVEALQGAVVRRGRAAGVPTPIMDTLYAVLKPHEHGSRKPETRSAVVSGKSS